LGLRKAKGKNTRKPERGISTWTKMNIWKKKGTPGTHLKDGGCSEEKNSVKSKKRGIRLKQSPNLSRSQPDTAR